MVLYIVLTHLTFDSNCLLFDSNGLIVGINYLLKVDGMKGFGLEYFYVVFGLPHPYNSFTCFITFLG